MFVFLFCFVFCPVCCGCLIIPVIAMYFALGFSSHLFFCLFGFLAFLFSFFLLIYLLIYSLTTDLCVLVFFLFRFRLPTVRRKIEQRKGRTGQEVSPCRFSFLSAYLSAVSMNFLYALGTMWSTHARNTESYRFILLSSFLPRALLLSPNLACTTRFVLHY